jgi:alcohol dehydrogenase class IV
MTDEAAADAFVRWLAGLKADLGIPATLAALRSQRQLVKADIPALVDVAILDTCHQTNPRPCTRGDFERIFAAAL